MNCPLCNKEIDSKTIIQDNIIVEEIQQCDCGYLYHYAYGQVVYDSLYQDKLRERVM